MKHPILLLTLILPLSAFATRPGLNECSPLPATKKYLSTDFHGYPRDVAFDCVYECNKDETIYPVNAISKVHINTVDEDALMTTCQGVVVKKTKWGYDFDKVVPFYAADTNLVEIKKWAFANVEFDPATNPLEKAKLLKLKEDLNQISTSYIIAGTSGGEATKYFLEAGKLLTEIAKGLPMNTKLLDEVLQKIIESKGETKAPGTSEALVEMMLSSAASWRIPPQN
ncbi:hypothetical protein SHI21_10660 [Bacteriovorax sp. PP10]|uniref:Secreted protein n=1 Tax=Bacteriovorax antarcticus TaxID=3088717 RepID=A0ABU5VYJ5_9BACT|nr:hypothetical protein [Bacteriovorax sp. PP10]MEA9356670.1 hypothetical protein [Bacteriovorax sp. PP10]